MSPYKAIIADDEPAAVSLITSLVGQFAPDITISGTAYDGLETVRLITRVRPQIVFLDVDMPVLNGIQVVEKLSGHDFQVIFTTGSAAHGLKALKLKAADYLLKPIDPAEFIMAVDRAQEQLELRNGGGRDPGKAAGMRIQLPTHNEIIFLEESEISHITGSGSYCQIMTTRGEKITVSKNIGQIEQKLSPHLFFRCHNSHIVNLDLVAKYLHGDGFFVEMKSGEVVEVSRRCKDGLLEALSSRVR